MNFIRQHMAPFFVNKKKQTIVPPTAVLMAEPTLPVPTPQKKSVTACLAEVLRFYASTRGEKVVRLDQQFLQFMDQCADERVTGAWATICLHLDNTIATEQLQELVHTAASAQKHGFDHEADCAKRAELVLDHDGVTVHYLKAYKDSPDVLDNIRYLYLTDYCKRFTKKNGSHLKNLHQDVVWNWGKAKADPITAAAAAIAKEDFNRINHAMNGTFVDKVLRSAKKEGYLFPATILDCQEKLRNAGQETSNLLMCSAFNSTGAFRALPFLVEDREELEKKSTGSRTRMRIDDFYVDLATRIKTPRDDDNDLTPPRRLRKKYKVTIQ
jgi:hypothetical protein